MQINLLYGTQSGTAEFLCEDLEAALTEHDCNVASLESRGPADLKSDDLHVFVIASYSTGDVTGTAQVFLDTLEEDKPDLTGHRFAVFGLGDQTFDTYNEGSEKMMQALLACKATMIGERGLFDASSADMPEDVATPWLKDLLGEFATT